MMSDPLSHFALSDPVTWAAMCTHIEKLADLPIKNLPAFLAYCQTQRDLAAERGFQNARIRIQQTVVSLQKRSES